MKTYIVYVNGEEKGLIKAASHNAAEKKAKAKYPPSGRKDSLLGLDIPHDITVVYTEV